MDFIAIDFETANPKRTSPCTLGLVKYENNKQVEEKYWKFKPVPFEFSSINLRITGLCEDDFMNSPTFAEAWNEIKPYFDNSLVFAHNTNFDINVLKQTLEYYELPFPSFQFCCTYLMSKVKFSDLENYKLNTVAKFMNLEQFNHHNALDDAIICGKIANILIQDKDMSNIENDFKLELGIFAKDTYKNCSIPKEYYNNQCYSCIKYPKKINENTINNYKCLFENNPFLNGQNIVITGDFSSFNRNELIELLKLSKVNIKSSVSKSTTLLLLGNYENISKKHKKALELIDNEFEIQIISEEELLNNLNKGAYLNV